MPSRSVAEISKTLRELFHESKPPSTSAYISLLQSCILLEHRGLPLAKKLQANITHHEVPLSGTLGDQLVLAFAKCGSLDDALLVSAQLPCLSVLSATALISAYTGSGRPYEALSFFQCMEEQGIPPSSYTLVCLLKACGIIQDLHQGMQFHASAMAFGFVPNGFVDNTLISMYGKCGAILDAEHIFYMSCTRNLVSWNAMLSVYVEHDEVEKALQLYVQMQDENVSPDRPTYITTLKACAVLAQSSEASCENGELVMALEIGHMLHSDIFRNGFAHNIFVNCSLIRVYGKCGALVEAESIFTALLHHDVVSCSALLSVYVEQGHGEKALHLYRQMLEEGIRSDNCADVLALQACGLVSHNQDFGQVAALEIGQALCAKAHKEGFEADADFHTSLVSLYGKCGAIEEAFDAVSVLSQCDVATWNALLCANVECGNEIMALHLYVQMQQNGTIPNQQTFVFALQACALYADSEEAYLVDGQFIKGKALSMGKAFHCDAELRSFTSDIILCNTILNMYAKCMALGEAEAMFCTLPHRNVVSWNTMLSGYVERFLGVTALRLYRQMQEEAACFTELTFVIALQACICLAENRALPLVGVAQSNKTSSLKVGRALHADACRKGLTSSALLMSTLVCMYSRCSTIIEAESMFAMMMRFVDPPWSMVLSIYVKHNKAEKALLWYMQMQFEGKCVDGIAIACAVQACAMLAEGDEACSINGLQARVVALKIGRALHADACGQGFMCDAFVSSAILSMYGKCGSISESEHVFEGLPQKTIVLWNAMLSAYVGQCQGEKVITLYQQIVKQHVTIDEVTLISALQGSSVVGNSAVCKQLHFDVICAGFDQLPSVTSCLFHAYGSCASMADAEDSLHKLSKQNTVSWNACIAGFVSEGDSEASLRMYEDLRGVLAQPSGVSLLMIISACGHAGLVVQGLDYFISMREDHNYMPEAKHYGSLLDLLGRAGDFRRVESVLRRMPVDGNLAIWSSLLGACCIHANMELARQVFDDALLFDPEESTAYVLLSNVSANAGLQEGSVGNGHS